MTRPEWRPSLPCLSASIAPPGVRMVVAYAQASPSPSGPPKTYWALDPVVALSVEAYGDDEPEYHALVVESGIRLTRVDDLYPDSNLFYRLVACPWPPEEDAVRLRPLIDALIREALASLTPRRPAVPPEPSRVSET